MLNGLKRWWAGAQSPDSQTTPLLGVNTLEEEEEEQPATEADAREAFNDHAALTQYKSIHTVQCCTSRAYSVQTYGLIAYIDGPTTGLPKNIQVSSGRKVQIFYRFKEDK